MLLTVEEIDNIAEVTGEREGAHTFAVALETKLLEKLCAGVEMPEAEIILAWDGWTARWEPSDYGDVSTRKDDDRIIGYTADQLRAHGAACGLKAIQDCDDVVSELAHDASRGDCGQAIRALRGEA